MGFIRSVDYDTVKRAPLGPGAVLCDLPDTSEESILEVLTETPGAEGFHLGGMTSAPNFTDDQDEIDFAENLVGATGSYMGMVQPMRVDPTITVEIAKMDVRNLQLIRPDFERTDRLGRGTRASATVGTTNSRYTVESAAYEASGNDVSFHAYNDGTNNQTLLVSVTYDVDGNPVVHVRYATNGSAATTSTANQVIAAINDNALAREFVVASLTTGSDGTGVAAGFTQAKLTGGVDGDVVGSTLERRGFYKITDYVRNVLLVCPLIDPDTGDIKTSGFVIELDNCLNRSDSFEFEPDEDGNLTGVSMELRAHIDLRKVDKATGREKPSYRIHTLEIPAAA